MSKTKKIVIAIAILSCVILAFMSGQSFSKYVSEVRGNGIAEIATWDFKVNGAKEEIQTIKLVSQSNNSTLTENKLAPGTEGSFEIIVDGTQSDVGINYHIQFLNETKKPTNLKFIYNNKQYDNISDLENILSGTIGANDENKTKTFVINWKWPYETGTTEEEKTKNNLTDTKDAQNIANYSFDVLVSGTQVQPEA